MRRYFSILYKTAIVLFGLAALPILIILALNFLELLAMIYAGDNSEYVGFAVGFYIISGLSLLLALGVQSIRKLF